jgi:hypothetical protein
MLPDIYYKERLEKLKDSIKDLLQKKSGLGWARFFMIVGIILSVYFLWPYGLGYVIAIAALLFIGFVKIVFIDLDNNTAIDHTNYLVKINDDELKALQHDYHHFTEGKQYIDNEHLYSNDLDIFGRASLFQYINRTNSEMGEQTLANWLLHPADISTIQERQKAVKELTSQTEWRQELQAIGKETKISLSTRERLQSWFSQPNIFINSLWWKWLRFLLPAIIISVVILYFFDKVSLQVLISFLLVFFWIAFYLAKKVKPFHEQLSMMVSELDVLSSSIRLLEKTIFHATLLGEIQHHYRTGNNKASSELKELKNILDRLDLSYNLVLTGPLNILLLWNLQQAIALEKWKERNKENTKNWFDALGLIEALCSFSTAGFNHPEWCFPVLKDEQFFMEGKEVGHPLINKIKRVNNDIKVDRPAELMLITGSNMAGKSTYLRSIGINVVLAMAGAPVCAGKFILSPVEIISSMRITDNLEESTSTFYAELKKLKIIIDKVNNGEPVFILLDEILRGTNSYDRHTGSVAFIKQLIKHNASAIIATHDIELAKMKETFPENILNYHFDVQVNDGELYFDYKLNEGICTSMNASILMKKIGIEI